MKVKLIRSGGLSGKIMHAEVEWTLPGKEYEELISTIRVGKTLPMKRKKDAFTYTLQKKGGKEVMTPIDPGKIPAQYYPLFKELFESLRPDDDK
jgi:hypothetical protein